ncbi:MAG: valine--tRNA ligase [Clostridiales Family XIII bacterium]|jgi:valyl-tRNA synthetase|nr:valine--tRNA ligase [Clostridiales Family XIII bacterium]
MRNLEKNYDPKSFETRIYREWEEGGYFRAEIDPAKKPFTIVMPPPNITGQLHMGHALDETLQDVLTRLRRMQGYAALWLPGTDHASIATEVKVAEEILQSEGKTKDELGREEFLKRAWEWREHYGRRITEQQRRLGNSCDWSRERFTMDEGLSKAVTEFFVRLYEKGFIYKGNRMINWCPVCGTSLSDAEVEHGDVDGTYWYFRYPAADGREGIVVATSRPETMFGDTAVAVSPEDARYRDMIGKTVVLPLVGREIPVVADEYPDPEKGTGAVKITPAHDPNDFEVGERHDLARIVCIGFDAKMTAEAGQYEGMDRMDCRREWVKALEAGGYLVKTEQVVIPTGRCYRCDTVVEPMISDQWFVRMEALARPAIEAAQSGALVHVPERFEKTYLHWLEGIRDWCISRQLWWGHRIPAWYCDACGEVAVARSAPAACPACGGTALTQDEDVLDTWFSSALWPVSTLGWPEKTPDLEYFYPTSVLVTGYDIIFFWVVRMVFSGLETMGESPFSHVFVHGLVRDEQGRKMSKSLGNGVDPLEVIDAYGADALRFFLLNGSAAGNDMRFIMKNVESTRNFANKLWNASRFVLMNLGEGDAPVIRPLAEIDTAALRDEDRWMLLTVREAAADITRNLEHFELSVATQKIYELIWNAFCDWYIEFAKPRLYGEDEADKEVCRAVLVETLSELLRLLHPFMPFLTEEIWGYLGKGGKLIADRWADTDAESIPPSFRAAHARVELAMNVVRAVRNIRAEAEAQQGRKLSLYAVTDDAAKAEALTAVQGLVAPLAGLTGLFTRVVGGTDAPTDIPDECATAVTDGFTLYVPLDDLLDYAAERERLAKEQARLEGEIARISGKLANEGFVSKAPEAVVQAERARLAQAQDSYEKVRARAEAIQGK